MILTMLSASIHLMKSCPMIGSGIFYLGAYVLQRTGMNSGLALICWLIGGVISLFGGLCYAELGTAMPKAGGRVVYLNEAYHPVVGFMQPAYEMAWGGKGKMYEQRLGERYLTSNPFREILDHGIRICGGSDIMDIRPMIGIHYAVNHPVSRHSVTLEEALKMYTSDGAYTLFLEDKVGSLRAGMAADIVILDSDIETVDKSQLKDVGVAMKPIVEVHSETAVLYLIVKVFISSSNQTKVCLSWYCFANAHNFFILNDIEKLTLNI